MKKFEYKIVDNDQRKLDHVKLIDFLNEHGNDGWELVDFQTQGGIQSMIFIKEREDDTNN